jgi:hypothetical protein
MKGLESKAILSNCKDIYLFPKSECAKGNNCSVSASVNLAGNPLFFTKD